jgi:hypothetical protein
MECTTIPNPRERDQVVMELIFGKVIDKKTIRSLSRCRGSLEIIFLSDMTTADGRYLEQFVFDPGSKVERSIYKCPRESPAKKDWDAWFNFWHDYTATGDKLHTPLGVNPLIPGPGQTMPRSVSRTRQHHLNVVREPSWLSLII